MNNEHFGESRGTGRCPLLERKVGGRRYSGEGNADFTRKFIWIFFPSFYYINLNPGRRKRRWDARESYVYISLVPLSSASSRCG